MVVDGPGLGSDGFGDLAGLERCWDSWIDVSSLVLGATRAFCCFLILESWKVALFGVSGV